MRPILFHLGDIPIPSFWTMAFVGFVVAFVVARNEILRRGYDVTMAYDMLLYAYIGGWIGARLFLIPGNWDVLVEDPFGFLFSSSGWVWYGGIIGGTVAVVLWRQWAAENPPSMLVLADIASPSLAIGLAIGRLGCQLSGDGDYGIPTDVPWGMSYPNGVIPTTDRVHPAPIYEMLGCLGIFAYLWHRRARASAPGDQFGHYLILSGALRFAVEFVRRNPAWLVGLTTAQWLSLIMIAVGAWLLRKGSRDRGIERSRGGSG